MATSRTQERSPKWAHAKGALVYADIIQATGAIPVDVEALGLDFAACSCYKWLQGNQQDVDKLLDALV